MKRSKFVVGLCLVALLLTGCVKFNANMDIKKDKSMDFSLIYAVNSSLLGNEELITADDKKELEEQGFTLEDYNKDNMKGFTLKRNIKNIDKVSNESDVEYSLSGILDKDSESKYIFKVKKGLLKNTYTAKFDFNTSDSDLSEELNDSSYLDDDDDTTGSNDYATDDDDLDFSDFASDADFSSMMSSMDLSFNVTLPYAVLSSNATSTDNDNKTLSWNLSTTQDTPIEFEFALYNMTNIYIGGGIILLVIIFIIASICSKSNGSAQVGQTIATMEPQNTPTNNPTTPNQTPTQAPTQTPVDDRPQELINENPDIFNSQPKM